MKSIQWGRDHEVVTVRAFTESTGFRVNKTFLHWEIATTKYYVLETIQKMKTMKNTSTASLSNSYF